MATESVERSLLEQLGERREAKVKEWSDLIASREAVRAEYEQRLQDEDEANKPSEAETEVFAEDEKKFRSQSEELETELRDLEERHRLQEEPARRSAAAAEANKGIRVERISEPKTYRHDNAREVSYFKDLAYSQRDIAGVVGADIDGAKERLTRHSKDTSEWMEKREGERKRNAERQVEQAELEFSGSFVTGVRKRGFDASPFEYRVTPNRTTGQGGEFVPPVWLIDEYIKGLRAGRIAAGMARNMDLPPGTDSINIPKLSTLTKTAPQLADNNPVASQDVTTTSVQANVKTIAGQEDVSIQLLEQSPGQIFDQVVMEDLIADYNRTADQMVLYGSGANASSLNAGQILGIYPSTNWSTNTVTWTSSSILGGGFLAVLNANASQISYNRYDLTNVAHLLHPRRWFWFASALDGASGTSGRPYVNVPASGLYDQAAIEVSDLPAEGRAGVLSAGQPVYIDGNVPITDNGSGALTGTYDVGITAKWDDLWFFEGDLRTRVLPEVLSGILAVRFQVYNYVAFLVRYGQSITLAQGTGFAAPQSAFDSSVKF